MIKIGETWISRLTNLDINIVKAERSHLAEIVALLAQDKLGTQRENYQDPLPESYINAFDSIVADPNQNLMVVLTGAEVIGTLQLTFIPYLTYQGGVRAQIEAVRIKESHRGQGLGAKVFNWAIEQSKSHGAHVVQLTTDKQRPEALKFYESLGFKPLHQGMKLHLRTNN